MRQAATVLIVCVVWTSLPAVGVQHALAESPPGDALCDPCGAGGMPCINGACHRRDRFWLRGEYVFWWTKGMQVPPLVTTSPTDTPYDEAGVLGQPGTEILFGDEGLVDELRWGSRLRVGSWLDPCRQWGIEGEYLALADDTDRFQRQSDGDPILARPFFNVLSGEQDAELVAYPGLIQGTVAVRASSEFQSAGVRMLLNLRREGSRGPVWVERSRHCGRKTRLDLLAGWRYVHLGEDLAIREDLVSTDPLRSGAFDILDRFDTRNEFHGGEIGLLWDYQCRSWSLELLAKVALGNSHQVVSVRGDTTITNFGVPTPYPGGILAQRTNSGRFSHDEFAVVPEVGVTLGYQLTRRMRATFGYSFIYLSHVVRPGEQIDVGVNPNLFPPERVPFSGPLRPAFTLHDTDYWAQGLSFGLDYRW